MKLPNFNDNTISYTEKFELLSSREALSNNNNQKDININHYINMSKMISKLIYAKNSKDKEGNYTIDRILDINQINDSNSKRSINKEYLFDTENNLNKLGLSNEDIINFESNFECGNLQFVYLMNSKEEGEIDSNQIKDNINIIKEENNNYELFLQNDINTKGHSQWFFFRISNGKKGKKIKLNIMNFQRKKTKYLLGIKIWYFSKKKKEEKNIGWHHTTEYVDYSQNFLYNIIKNKRYFYYTLSFEYTFEYDNDEIYFSNSIPFTYSDIIKDLNYYTKKENEKYNFFERKKLCSTILGNDVDYFNINNDNDLLISENREIKNKKGIILFARQHPGETVGNWILKGAYEYLMSFNKEVEYLRDKYIIKIIPMINVDGVICGNSRTSLSGCDLNRRWVNPDEYLHPEIYYLKELILNFSKSVNVEYIIDFHGHFGAFNSFFYGNNIKEDLRYCKYFPFVCGKISNVILFDKSSFKMPKYKKGTGRIQLFNELSIENIFTLETSYFGCNQGKYNNQYFNIDILKEIGRDICKGILLCHYNSVGKINININNDIIKLNKEFDKYIDNISNKTQNDELNKEGEKEEQEKDEEDISDSESEPSRDNLEEEQIKKLFPFFYKRKTIKIIKRKKMNSFLKNKNNFIKKKRITKLYNKFLDLQKNSTVLFPKVEKKFVPPTHKNNNNILIVNSLVNNNMKQRNLNEGICSKLSFKNKKLKFLEILKNKFNTNITASINTIIKSFEDKETQTEERFFSVHWSYFFGIYKILSANYDKKKYTIAYPLLIKYDRIDYLKKSKFKSTATMVSSALNKIKMNIKENNKNNTGRNDKHIQYVFNSDYDKTNYMNSLIIKNDYQKILISDNDLNTDRIVNLKNKIKHKEKSVPKIILSFVSSSTSMKKDDYLRKYLNDESRINCY